MKLRGLALENMRKFAGQRAEIRDIGDGITVISEANEFGKSTFFDALHALFFIKYGAAGKEVQALRSPAGGAVRVSAEIELPSGIFFIEKTYLAQKRATVKDAGGRVIRQDDEAEAWIAQLMGSGIEGPAGLLWVRQGVTAMEPADATARDRTRLMDARRDLLSSVAGEIDMVTGGRRMDRVQRAALDAVERLATATGRPRAGGPWHAAQQEAEAQLQRRESLAKVCDALRGALDRRQQVTRHIQTLADPDLQAARQRALEQARAEQAVAQAHADRLKNAQTQADLKALERDGAQARLDTLIARKNAQAAAARTLAEAEKDLADAAQTLSEEEGRAREADEALGIASDAAQALRDVASAQQAAATRRQTRALCDSAARAVAAAAAQRDKAEAARAALAPLRVTDAALADIERAADAVARARADPVEVVTLRIAYEGDVHIQSDGADLPEGAHPVARMRRLTLPGIGTLTVDPGEAAQETGAQEAAERALAKALADVGAYDLVAARAAARQRKVAEDDLKLAEGMLRTLAPDGMAPLQAALAEAQAQLSLPGADEGGAEPAACEDLPVRLAQAQAEEDAARARTAAVQAARAQARTHHALALSHRDTAAQTLQQAQAALGSGDTHAAAQTDAARDLAKAQAAAEDAQTAVQALAGDAPDLATVAAALARAQGAVDQAAEEYQRLQKELAALSAVIRTRAEEGVEEALTEATEKHAAADARAQRFAGEVAALRLLLDTLEDTREAAQEAYFGPIQQELQPLVSILDAGAALSFDPATLLPGQLTRDGTEEALDQLSGGTREQIAILTRLAFARLFAKQGKPMPVILDDALVYSDDDRIERMFTALHRAAADQQVIVFTCRQRAFANLGGTRPLIRIAPIS